MAKHWLERWIEQWETGDDREHKTEMLRDFPEEPVGDNEMVLGLLRHVKQEMPMEEPYRAPALPTTEDRLDDHEGRLEVLEHIADGGDLDQMHLAGLNKEVHRLRGYMITFVMLLVITILGEMYFATRLHGEMQAQIEDNQYQIERLERLQCRAVAGYKTSSESQGL